MIRLTAHASEMLEERGIAIDWVVAAVENAAIRLLDPRDPGLVRSFVKVAEAGDRVLRVVHRLDGADVLIITAHFDRGAKL